MICEEDPGWGGDIRGWAGISKNKNKIKPIVTGRQTTLKPRGKLSLSVSNGGMLIGVQMLERKCNYLLNIM